MRYVSNVVHNASINNSSEKVFDYEFVSKYDLNTLYLWRAYSW